MVRGVVKSKSLVPAGDAYIIEIDLPAGLTTFTEQNLISLRICRAQQK